MYRLLETHARSINPVRNGLVVNVARRTLTGTRNSAYIRLAQIFKNSNLLTYSMEQIPPCEANQFSASQDTPHISRNPKVHYRTHKCPPPVSILGQHNPVHIPTSHLLEIHLNIFHPSTPRPSLWSPSLRFPQHDPIHPLSSPIRATCPAHLILLDFITRTVMGKQYRSLSSSLGSFVHSTVTSSLLCPNILVSTLFPNTLSLCSSLNVSDQVPNPYKTTRKL